MPSFRYSKRCNMHLFQIFKITCCSFMTFTRREGKNETLVFCIKPCAHVPIRVDCNLQIWHPDVECIDFINGEPTSWVRIDKFIFQHNNHTSWDLISHSMHSLNILNSSYIHLFQICKTKCQFLYDISHDERESTKCQFFALNQFHMLTCLSVCLVISKFDILTCNVQTLLMVKPLHGI